MSVSNGKACLLGFDALKFFVWVLLSVFQHSTMLTGDFDTRQ